MSEALPPEDQRERRDSSIGDVSEAASGDGGPLTVMSLAQRAPAADEIDSPLDLTRDRLEMALEAADMGMWEYDFRTRVVTRNLRHDQLFGYDELQPDWRRSTSRTHFLPEDRPLFDEAFAEAARNGRLLLEARVRWPDGSIRWLRTIGRTYYDEAGEPVKMVGVVLDETDRWHAGEALLDRERELSALADAMPQLVWTARADGTVDYYNKRVAEYDGFEFKDGGWTWDLMLHPDDVESTIETWNRAIETGNVYQIEHRVKMKDGRFRWHLTRAFPVRDEATDEVVRWYGTSTNIEDLKAAQTKVQIARDRLEVALEAAEMGTWETDFVTGKSHRSLRHDQIFGYDELQPEWNLDVARSHVLPEDLEVFDRSTEEGQRTGQLRHEVRIRRRDGSVRWIYSLGRFDYDEAGEPIRRAGVIMDITERREVEEALRVLNDTLEEQVAARTAALEAARDHFRTAFEAGPTASAILDRRNGRILEVNEEFASFFGHSKADLVGKTMDELQLWTDDDGRKRIIRDMRRQRSIRNLEVLARLRNGEHRAVLASVEPITLNEAPCALVMFMDITQRKQAEEEVRRLSSALTMAEHRERRRLSHVLHDDLQQILFGVEMRAAVLEQCLTRENENEIGAVTEHIDTLRELVKMAIRSTRVLSIELNPPILRGEGLSAALGWLVHHMKEVHGLTVETEVDDEIDLSHAEQCLLVVQLTRELLFNVVKHAEVDMATLQAHLRDDTLHVVVADAGVGFDVGELRGSRSYRDSLGLFSVEERLRLFGGMLHIDSEVDVGTRIHIELPLARISDDSKVG